ncbi:hypothetical protein DPSP01_001996 [Paraphaeosphaeria sporulosa]|uniref:Luciferase domain-containing protein n=1 Tax=Paraphaeosphaeria sporulosa TaxID=1460663 RepID=A0A177CYB5_9PLEO|nr:uncharacterized protein CC84DRAFT_1135327 [Paraphaeosphaeria sporulosa]OAG12555.1 hypothetical protein CC84DRAFT_1135327 [Paraphaeosphaeria sporulosa]
MEPQTHAEKLVLPHPPFESPAFHLLAAALTFLLPFLTLVYIHADYKAFLSLGPGGTPATPLGYAKIKLLSILCLRDPLRPAHIPPHFRPQRGYLSATSLPTRPGRRPVVRGIAPQRQQTQKSTCEIYTALVAAMRALIADPANCLLERTSCFEKHSSGIFASTPITRTCGGEVCHAHPSDGSLHMTLHPADAKIVLERGWGERHPLARGGWCRRFVPKEFVLIYAPRSVEEVGTVMQIVGAGVWWVAGIDVRREGSERRDEMAGMEAFVRGGGVDCHACRVHGCGSKSLEGSMAGSA